MTADPTPTPQPWRPDGEGWETYRLGDVRGLDGWEVFCSTHNRTPLRCGPVTGSRLPSDQIVYARPIPEPPISVGDRVTCEGAGGFSRPLPVRYVGATESVVETEDGDLLIRLTARLMVPDAPALTTHRCPS